MKNKNKLQSGKIKLRTNLVIVIGGIVSIFLTKNLIEAKRQDDIRNIGYRINNYRKDLSRLKFMNAKLVSELEKVKKPDAIIGMLRKYGVKLSMPTLERTTTISLKNGKKIK